MTTIFEQLVDAQVEAAKERVQRGDRRVRVKTGDADIDGALDSGDMELVVPDHASDTVTLYDTSTGEPRQVLVGHLGKTLSKRRAGKPAFSMQPLVEYRRGETMCFLHPDHPQRAFFDSIGLQGKVCGDANLGIPPAARLASEYDRELHMQHKHRREWAVIQENRERMEKEEDRRQQREQMAAIIELAKANGGATPSIFYCAEGCGRFFDTEQGAKLHRTKEHRE